MNPLWVLRTARLVLTPVGGADLADLRAIKADPRVFAIMLGGVRSPQQTAEDLADDIVDWGAYGFGTWTIREAGQFLGITGLERRPDGRGVALRFAIWPEAQGRALAREAASAALRFGHRQAGLSRIVAVAREHNFASRVVLGGIGMTECDSFVQSGHRMVMYESVLPSAAAAPFHGSQTQLPDRPLVAQVSNTKDFQRTRP
ncbi:MAG TPA: GNAT family N-acetyltransferase [Acetobacteraceae bacterium]|jgi:RimJ/RimL family protein N-acetyltransferase